MSDVLIEITEFTSMLDLSSVIIGFCLALMCVSNVLILGFVVPSVIRFFENIVLRLIDRWKKQ